EDEDHEFQSPVESESDEVDSDFDIEENDEVISDHEDDENTSRKRRVITKAYIEPVYKVKNTIPGTSNQTSVRVKKTRLLWDDESSQNKVIRSDIVEKKLRKSTLEKSEAAAEQRQQMNQERNELRVRLAQSRRYETDNSLTQEELLEEAKETEIDNLKSLERFQQYELEKKKFNRSIKQHHIQGPVIRYFSTNMPLGENERCSRTFISFSDDKIFREIFSSFDIKNSGGKTIDFESKKLCPITGLPAKYKDPVTSLYYANVAAFRTIREAYHQHVEKHGDKKDASVSKWLSYNNLKSNFA
uniref:Vacuolar protein sorting-associated protein 72 homolog n=1 Tax=Romanomermis culicivorax TaxID=13658 RepID=A0A915KBZ2_ROMCU